MPKPITSAELDKLYDILRKNPSNIDSTYHFRKQFVQWGQFRFHFAGAIPTWISALIFPWKVVTYQGNMRYLWLSLWLTIIFNILWNVIAKQMLGRLEILELCAPPFLFGIVCFIHSVRNALFFQPTVQYAELESSLKRSTLTLSLNQGLVACSAFDIAQSVINDTQIGEEDEDEDDGEDFGEEFADEAMIETEQDSPSSQEQSKVKPTTTILSYIFAQIKLMPVQLWWIIKSTFSILLFSPFSLMVIPSLAIVLSPYLFYIYVFGSLDFTVGRLTSIILSFILCCMLISPIQVWIRVLITGRQVVGRCRSFWKSIHLMQVAHVKAFYRVLRFIQENVRKEIMIEEVTLVLSIFWFLGIFLILLGRTNLPISPVDIVFSTVALVFGFHALIAAILVAEINRTYDNLVRIVDREIEYVETFDDGKATESSHYTKSHNVMSTISPAKASRSRVQNDSNSIMSDSMAALRSVQGVLRTNPHPATLMGIPVKYAHMTKVIIPYLIGIVSAWVRYVKN